MIDQAGLAARRADVRWPARAQRLLGEVRALCGNWLHEPLRLSLADFDSRLREQAERARSHLDQQSYFATRQRLPQERQLFDRSFVASVERAFDRLGEPAASPAAAADQPLSLLDPLEHELTAAVDQLVARGESRGGPLLIELGYRLAVLIGAPPLEGEALPVGPQAMARAFREASQALDLPGEHRLLLLQSVEGSLIQELPPLYELINAQLLGEGILPGLRAFPLARIAVRRGREPEPPPREGSAPAETARNSEPIAVLDSLRELLAQRRHGQGGPLAGGHVATAGELETALAALQQHIGQVSDHVSRELRSAQRLRDELLQQLNAARPPGSAPAQLSPEQGDTVELVAMLFEQMARQLQQGGQAQNLLGGLQLPLLRVAMADRQFFEQRGHPARQLLGKVTEAAHDWIDDAGSEADRGLRARLEQLVERAAREQPSNELFAALLADVEQHLAQLRHKAQVAERRHVEAMQGRERLEQARQRAAELMAERFAKAPPRGLLRTLLERAWSDVLALTLLRHGEESDTFATRLIITDQLLGRLPLGDRRKLQDEVEAGLQQIGMHGDEAVQVAQRLIGAGAASGADGPSATGLAMRLKQHQRLGEQAGEGAAPSPSAAATAAGATVTASAPAPANPEEQRILARLRELPFGSWFEFVDAASGQVTLRKLAWFSPVSGNSLFVTRRGQRAEEIALPQLAHEIASGRVREAPRGHDGLLDRAWRALARSLRQAPRPAIPGAQP
jgi:hypothetical protein